MKAIEITQPGGPDTLQLTQVEKPTAGVSEVLIEVCAAGVNRPDCLQRAGLYPIPPGANPLPGLEVAGRVVAAGSDVQGVSVGDEVMALTHGGGYAEYCTVEAKHCLPKPKTLTWAEAAAIPETLFTVWSNVWMRGGLQPREQLLVHGGSSGIGSMAIQLATALGNPIIVTAGSDEKCAFCESIGASHSINYKSGSWREALQGIQPNGVDVILDMVGGSYFVDNLASLRHGGRLAIIALIGGATAPEANLASVLRSHLTVFGSTLRPQSTAQKAAIAEDIRAKVLPMIEAGTVRPPIFRVFDLENASDAHTVMESGRHMGKLVLNVQGEG
ncbi:MAG: NAD(P)H-quinone oxidoreductase [Pseudomonadota bacterium]